MKARYLDRELTRCALYYCLCLSEAEYHAELRRLKIPPWQWNKFKEDKWDGARINHHKHDGKPVAIVCMDLDTALRHDPVQVCAMLVHEAVHIWQRHAEYIGSDNDHGAEEEAYAIQNISQALMEEFRRRIKPRR